MTNGMKAGLLLILSAATGSAMAQQMAPHAEERVEIHLSNFHFTPETIHLQHGEPYTLVIVNDTRGSHDFTARAFFAAATMDTPNRAKLSGQGVSLSGKQSVTLQLTAPAPGTYNVKCTHFMHSAMGMKGRILVS